MRPLWSMSMFVMLAISGSLANSVASSPAHVQIRDGPLRSARILPPIGS